MALTANRDNFHDEIWYFTYDSVSGDSADIDFGDGQTNKIFPPRGQITHQFDKPGVYKVSANGESVRVKIGG